MDKMGPKKGQNGQTWSNWAIRGKQGLTLGQSPLGPKFYWAKVTFVKVKFGQSLMGRKAHCTKVPWGQNTMVPKPHGPKVTWG